MSETRFTPEQLLDPSQFHEDMLKQAAQDARVIEQLRAFIERSLRSDDHTPDWYMAFHDMSAELDRLAPPQRQETP